MDHRADIFAFGCLLYELTTGQQPFRGKNLIETLNRITNIEPDRLETIDGALPAELQRILDKCLAKNPAARYQSARDLAVDVRSLTAAVDTGTAAPLSSNAPGPTQRMTAVLGAAVVIGSIAVGSVATWWLTPAQVTEEPRRQLVYLDENLSRHALWDPLTFVADSERLAYVTADHSPNGTNTIAATLWIRAQDQLEGIRIAEDVLSPGFSPDGRWVVFRQAITDQLVKVATDGGGTQVLADAGNIMRGVSWGRNGDIVYAPANGSGGLFTVAAEGGEPLQLTTPTGAHHRFPHHLPDGKSLIYTSVAVDGSGLSTGSAGAGRTVLYLDLDTLESIPIHEGGSDARLVGGEFLVWAEQGALFAAPFDARAREISGPTVQAADNVYMDNLGTAIYSVSEAGTLAYMRGKRAEGARVMWADVTDPILPAGDYFSPVLSPDGKQLVYSIEDAAAGRASLWVVDLDAGTPQRLTFGEEEAINAVWSADGSQLFYMEGQFSFDEADDDGFFIEGRLMRMRTDTWAGAVVVLEQPGYLVEDVGPDGALVLSRLAGPDNFDLYLGSADAETEPQPLATSPEIEAWPAISPDGGWLAYGARIDGQFTIVVQELPDGARRHVTYPAEAGHPRWSADGATLYFRVNGGVLAAPFDTSTGQIGASSWAAVGFGGIFAGRTPGNGKWLRDYDVAPDGRILILAEDTLFSDADTGHVVMVQGWVDEVIRLIEEAR